MNSEVILYILLTLACIQLLVLIGFHIIGEFKISKRHINKVRANKKIRKYNPTLSAIIIQNNISADLNSSLDSVFNNGYGIDEALVIDTTPTKSALKQVIKYRKNNRSKTVHNFSLGNSRNYKSQSTKILKKLNSKLLIIFDSDSFIDSGNLIQGIEVFRDTKTQAAIPARQIDLNNKLLVAVFSIRQFLVRHFMRAFADSNRLIKNKLQPALIIRTAKYKKINQESLALTDINQIIDIIKSQKKRNSIKYADLISIKSTSIIKIKTSYVFPIISITYLSLIGVLIYQMGLYGSIPYIAFIIGLLALFTFLSTSHKNISISDRLSLILLSPLTIITLLTDPIFIYFQNKNLKRIHQV